MKAYSHAFRSKVLSIFVIVVFCLCLLPAPLNASAMDAPAAGPAGDGSVLFFQNIGQYPEGALFQVWGGGNSAWLVKDGFWVTLIEPVEGVENPRLNTPEGMAESLEKPGVNLKFSFVDANPGVVVEPFGLVDTSMNFFLGNNPGNWVKDAPVWSGVLYHDLYPGIDLKVYTQSGQIIMSVAANNEASLNAVKLQVDGADSVTLEGDNLTLQTGMGDFSFPLLQVENSDTSSGFSPQVTGNLVSEPFTYTKATVAVDEVQSDKIALLYGTYIGGNGNPEQGVDVASDADQAMYVTGKTNSTDFPTTTGAFHSSGYNVFLIKLDPTGKTLEYGVLVGGATSGSESYPTGFVLDAAKSVYITGYTNSSDFPTTTNAFDQSYNNMTDAFIFKINPSENTLEYSSYLGGSGRDLAYGITIDAANNVYVAGTSSSSDFPITPGALSSTLSEDIFVLKLNTSTSGLMYSAMFGTSGIYTANSIDIDATGSAYVTGSTTSKSFSVTTGAYDTTFNGTTGYDAYMAVLNPDGSALSYATYLGGSLSEEGYGIATVADGTVYIAGVTSSIDFPTSTTAFDTSYNGNNNDIFVTKLLPAGNGAADLIYSTYLGGNRDDWVFGITINSNGNALLTGYTDSSNFPVSPNAAYPIKSGYSDGIFTRVSTSGESLEYSTYFGGSESEVGLALYSSSNGDVLITGVTDSNIDFPVTTGAFDTTYNKDEDAFLIKFGIDEIPPDKPNLLLPNSGVTVLGTPAYSWSVPGDAVVSVYQYDNNSDFSSPVFTSAELTESSYTPPLQAPGTWFWHVKVRDFVGNWSEWSDYRTITIKPPVPAAPVLLKPAANAFIKDSTPLLTWKSVPYGKKYVVQVSAMDTFKTLEQEFKLQPGVLKVVTATLKDGKHYWRVMAINSLGQKSVWSKVRAFTVDTIPPAAPTLVRPSNNSTITEIPTFYWTEVKGAKYYHIEISKNNTFTDLVDFQSALTVWYYKPSSLPKGTYYWHVKVMDFAGNNSKWSATWKFILK